MANFSRHLELILQNRKSHAKGTIGEFLALDALQRSGYEVVRNRDDKAGDLTAFLPDGRQLAIEVKTSTKCKDGKYHFQLFKMDKHGSTNHLNSDVILFLAATKLTVFFFLVPSQVLRKNNHFSFTDPLAYRGKLAQYRIQSQQIRLESVL